MPKSKVKGGGTKKVCLPAAKVRSMSKSERQSVVRAKRKAAASGKYKRSSKSNVKGARKKGATLRDWFEKENWINVATGRPCGESSKKSPVKKLRKTTKGKGRHFLSADEGAGMTEAGRKAYKKENPGSKLSAPVTGKVKPGSKAAKRRKSFCARSKSWTSERGKAARRRWKC
tara:strand:- start:2045 stop:2563 length:519 start_codon:yes stop_codon:yes gene_type:complete